MYRFQARREARHLSEGARLQVLGQATVWAPRGRLQFVVDKARPQGRGALLEALEKLKASLAAEGLFAVERKRPLPSQARVVGVVTSAAGAAFHDICTVALRRGRARIVLSSATVQGEGASESIIRAVDLLERYPALDLMIVGRGGGSMDDLMAFNDERVVRRLARVRVPVISAVGHEIDFTLTDLVADVRAATPSEAAELAVVDHQARRETLERCLMQLARAMGTHLLDDRSSVTELRARLADPRFLIAERQQEVDELLGRLERHHAHQLKRSRGRLESLSRRLVARHPRAVIARARARFGPLDERLRAGIRLRLRSGRARLSEQAARLEGISPLSVLDRGYAIATRTDGRAIRAADEVSQGETIGIRLARGSLDASVTGVWPTTDRTEP